MKKFSSILRLSIYLCSVFCLFPAAQANNVIDHLQPQFWWTGMAHSELQIMVHGEDIGSTTPQLSYPGVELVSIDKVENPNYLFINVSLADDVQPGFFDITFSRKKDKVATFQYELKARVPNSANRQGFTPADSIYLITPDRFVNGDTSNDAVAGYIEQPAPNDKGGRHGGDIQGIINSLDYIADMGFTQIWLMPVTESNMDRGSYHGYATTDYYQIDKRYGDNNLYRTLSQQAQDKGIGLIMDMILNHIGSDHWWMRDLPDEQWINNKGKFKPTNHRREAIHDPHGTLADQQGFNDGWFVPTMPDLNQRHPLLAKYLIQNAVWWVEYAGLSGIRVDTYSYSDKNFLGQWTKRLMTEYPLLNIVGEEWSTNPAIVAYWQKGAKRYDEYQSSLPSVMDFPLQDILVKSLQETESWNSGLRRLYEIIATDFLYADPYNLVIFADNHDMSRIITQFEGDIALQKMAISFFLTTRGIPQIYYGTEVLMDNPGTEDHGVIRTNFPGGFPGAKQNAFTGVGLTQEQVSTQSFMRKLLNWRKTNSAIADGKLTHFAPEKGTYVYFRHNAEQVVMVVLNKNKQAVELDLSRFSSLLQGFSKLKNVLDDSTQNIQPTLAIEGTSAQVFELHQ